MKTSPRRLRFAAPLLCSLAMSMALSACASQRMETAGTAWELIPEREVVGAKSKASPPASHKVVHSRKPVTLSVQGEPNQAMQSGSLAGKSMDDRSPTGWTRAQLIEQWGVPALVDEDKLVYRNASNGRCASLTLRSGVVSSVKSSC